MDRVNGSCSDDRQCSEEEGWDSSCRRPATIRGRGCLVGRHLSLFALAAVRAGLLVALDSTAATFRSPRRPICRSSYARLASTWSDSCVGVVAHGPPRPIPTDPTRSTTLPSIAHVRTPQTAFFTSNTIIRSLYRQKGKLFSSNTLKPIKQ